LSSDELPFCLAYQLNHWFPAHAHVVDRFPISHQLLAAFTVLTALIMLLRFSFLLVFVLSCAFLPSARADETAPLNTADELSTSFKKTAHPFLQKHCQRCHRVDEMMSGIRVDGLDASFKDQQLKLWIAIRNQLRDHAMPPEDEPQPSDEQREHMIDWIARGVDFARSRPVPKNGTVRRLTVAQYRNTLRSLLLLEDDLTDILPPDAVSRDGFVNNRETLELSPLLLETYFEIAERALDLCIVDPEAKPTIQNFRVDLGVGINAEPFPEKLILGANSRLLNNADFTVTELAPEKPFAFEPFAMRTKYRFHEGYEGNSTVRGWREYDSLSHAVYACVRGNNGYPIGRAYTPISDGLLLRPAIPSAEMFGVESTYGPRANFKVSLRELPDHGRFRVTVNAAKYIDGLLLEPGTAVEEMEPSVHEPSNSIECRTPETVQQVSIKTPGIYRVDAHIDPINFDEDASRLADDLIGAWSFDGDAKSNPDREELTGQLANDARFVESPFGHSLSLDGENDSVIVPRHASMDVGDGDFSVAAWIHPYQLRQAGIVCLGKYNWTHGWYFDMPSANGVLRIETVNPDNISNGTVASDPGVIHANKWQHVAAVVKRGENQTRLYVNGYPVSVGTVQATNLDNPNVDLHIGRIQDAQQFNGQIDDVRIYRRALDVTEIQALVAPGRDFVTGPPATQKKELQLTIGNRPFFGTLNQTAFMAVRLPSGMVPIQAHHQGMVPLDRLVLTRLNEQSSLAQRFAQFEKRNPKLGVHLGLRRDCGSTLTPVEKPQAVSSDEFKPYIFEGAIRNFPSPEVNHDNVNYLAGVREIGVRSEYTDGRDMPQLLIGSVEFEGPFYESWPPATHRNIFFEPEEANGGTHDPTEAAQRVIHRFASRAFRRAVSDDEMQTLMAVYHDAIKSGRSDRDSVRDSLLVILTSPQFLFLIENSQSPEPEAINQHELASKLSYFLWNDSPDDVLLQLANAGELRQHLDGQLTRMIDDGKFEQFLEEFASQWLTLEKFDVLESDRKRFPNLTRDARTQLRQEPVAYLGHLIRLNLPVRNIVASEFVVVNEVVAHYYGLDEQCESGFEFAAVATDRNDLGGLLTHPAILAGLSNGREANPVKRGAWLARKIVAEPPDDPPPNVPALEETAMNLTLRERLEQHRNQTGCVKCHEKIDPWGVPFQQYDAGGLFRSTAVDAASVLPDQTPVAGVRELQDYLAEKRSDQIAYSFLKHLTTYATGRTLTYHETEYIREQQTALKENGYRMRDMFRFVVNSPMFLEK